MEDPKGAEGQKGAGNLKAVNDLKGTEDSKGTDDTTGAEDSEAESFLLLWLNANSVASGREEAAAVCVLFPRPEFNGKEAEREEF